MLRILLRSFCQVDLKKRFWKSSLVPMKSFGSYSTVKKSIETIRYEFTISQCSKIRKNIAIFMFWKLHCFPQSTKNQIIIVTFSNGLGHNFLDCYYLLIFQPNSSPFKHYQTQKISLHDFFWTQLYFHSLEKATSKNRKIKKKYSRYLILLCHSRLERPEV